MKVAILQQGMRTTTGTQDWTDASVSSDLVAALFWSNQATANATGTSQIKSGFGATDLTNNVSWGIGVQDGLSTPASSQYLTNAACLTHIQPGSGPDIVAAYSSTLSNGVRINYTTVNGTAYLTNCLLISGTDMEVKVSSGVWGVGNNSQTITHGHAAAPNYMIVISGFGLISIPNNNTTYGSSIGFWDGTNSAGVGIQHTTAANPTAIAGYIDSAGLGHAISGDVDKYGISVANVGATTYDLVRTSAPAQASAIVVSFRKLSGSSAASASIQNLPTSTGNSALVTGMAVAPQILFSLPTRMTATGSLATDDTTGSFGIGIACNNGGTTQQMAWASTAKDNVVTAVAKSRTENATALLALDNTGAVSRAATVNSWDSGGVTLNHSTVTASADRAVVFALGVSAANSVAPIANTLNRRRWA